MNSGTINSNQPSSQEHVAILLGTKDGERFLGEQLQSYVAQSHADWSLHVSDDGSSDATRDVVTAFAETRPACVTLRDGPCQGFSRNFMSLARDPSLQADYFAFSDQDDIWYPDKLERALGYLRTVSESTPAMYCSRTELVDERRRHLGFSPLFVRPPAFRNALVQNIGGGNTMVFNAAAKRLLEATGHVEIVSHDWWVYQVVSAVGGAVFYDSQPSMEYRQHDDNVLGSNSTMRARIARLRMMMQGRLVAWNDLNIAALDALRAYLHPGSMATLDNFKASREASWALTRLFYLRRSGIYRQTVPAQIGLFVSACLRKL